MITPCLVAPLTLSLPSTSLVLAHSQPYTEKVDVYSYGIVVWSLATNSLPFAHITKRCASGLQPFIDRVCVHGERPPLDAAWPAPFSRLLAACWDGHCAHRPSFQTVLVALEGISPLEA